ncbi:MAG: hypothetical protein KJ067_22555 [Vicinamibacteria bacterium]|nr:hypothetical protein [Vicinamibacteria bacterium]
MKQPGRLERSIEIGANLAIILTALMIGGVAWRAWSSRTVESRRPAPGPQAGVTLQIPGVEWPASTTYLLVLSADCAFCTESAGFYRQLVERAKANPKRPAVIALLPQPPEAGRSYLRNHAIAVDEVLQVDPRSIGVGGTPTIILVDSRGITQRVWAARLDPSREREVLASMDL